MTDAKPRACLSILDGVALMVGIVVGVGIFRTPPLVAANVGSETAFILAWFAGGAAVLIGALCYAELAAAHPNVGGEYHFLRRAFGRQVSLLFAWARCTVIQPGAIAAVAFVYGDYAQEILNLGIHGSAFHAAIAIALLTALNIAGTPQFRVAQIVLTIVTLGAVASVVVAGFSAGPIPASDPVPVDGSAAFGMAMVFVLLTYGGWNEAAYLSGELRNVQRSMLRVLIYGTVVIVVTYTLINLAFLNVLGLDGLRAVEAPAAELMRAAAGERGVTALSLIVCIAALSTINATIFTGARAYYALGRDVPQLGAVGHWDARGDTPLNGLFVQGAIALALVLLGAVTRNGFQAMVDYTAPVFWLFMMLVSVSLFVLRRAEPDRARPFKVPLYPVVPALFTLICGGLLYSSLVYTGNGAFFGVGVLVAGLPLLLLRSRPEHAPAE